MKKTFLISGALAALFATNGYAVQFGEPGIGCSCPSTGGQSCSCIKQTVGAGIEYSCRCRPDEPNQKPVLTTYANFVADSNQINVVQQNLIESTKPIEQKKAKKVSARAAEMPKATKKIVYEEVVSDNAE